MPSYEIIVEELNNYIPVENRLNKFNAFNKEIVFDGDISTVGRLKQLASNKYQKSYLVLRKMGSCEVDAHLEDFYPFLDRFNQVFLFSDTEFYDELKDHSNVTMVVNHDFISKLDGTIFYHYSGYFRVFDIFNEKNLVDIDKEIYKIYREKEVM